MSARTCEFCGKPLEPVTVSFLGRERVIGFHQCDCPEAKAQEERERVAKELEEARKKREAYERKLQDAGIPKRYLTATHRMSNELCDLVRDGHGLFITGAVGCGKTYLAASLTRQLIDSGVRAHFTSSWRVLDLIKQSFNTGGDPMARLQRYEVLVIDDLGNEQATPFSVERLFALIDSRFSEMRPTIVTSQYSPNELVARLASSQATGTAEAIVSRLMNDSRFIHLEGSDRRTPMKRTDTRESNSR